MAAEPNRTDSTGIANTDVQSNIQAVALDMDGLLFDTERIYWQVGDTILQRRGFRYSAELQALMMGRIGTAAVQQMIDFHQLDDSAEDLLEESDEVYGELLPSQIRPMPGLEQWVNRLRESGLPFALTTSSRRKWVDVIFETVAWREELAFVLTGDDVTNGKPHPEMYLSAAARFGIAPENMLVLEDSGNGTAAGVAAGAIVVSVPSPHTKDQDFQGAALIADSLLDTRLWELLPHPTN
ncbi:HAD family hydrolase [Rhodopirellula sp. MGV]|uniref:HAD family hydrolase n=1 Tax=Rhodopirellula sp. MGV TaxID=2023130 RepID=UPI000B96EDB1|nr:HAD-IA family hydrolase [Rhodopirellula sp. MGV]OYP32375.1 HAD family hydrolase [Rhodopirellula sp. MGV]PNY35840.1 HAD family hydrolase [Rhodopirellula baltica]